MFFVIIFIKQPKFVEEGVRRERERRGKEERKEGSKTFFTLNTDKDKSNPGAK